MAVDAPGQVEQATEAATRWVRRRGGWIRVLRNTGVGYVQQAGSRMAAALAFYSLLLGGPALILTLVLGSALFGEAATKLAVAQLLQGVLPQIAGGGPELAQEVLRTSRPTASLALLAGLGSFFGFTRALTSCLNVTLRAEGAEPLKRAFMVGPLFVVAVIGLVWGAWGFRFLVEMVYVGTGARTSWLGELLLVGLAPLVLATLYFAIILAVIPRVQLTRREVLVPSLLAGVLWETSRHLFGWLVGADNLYLQVFGLPGGIMALLGWVYLSAVILVLTGQFAWAYAMECRGRGHLACDAPRAAALNGWLHPFEGDHAVNEDQNG
jgi:membrane protein